jgi:hypothetical protein
MSEAAHAPFRHPSWHKHLTYLCVCLLPLCRYVRGWLTPFIFILQGVCLEEFSKVGNFYFLVRVIAPARPRHHHQNISHFGGTLWRAVQRPLS